MSEEVQDRGGKIPTFDGEAKNFAMWWKKFLAYAAMSRFKDILKEERDKHLPEKEVSDDEIQSELTKEQQTAIKKNEIAMASFSIAFMTEKAMNIVYASCNKNWPEGEAYLVVRELMKRYQPLDTVSKIEMRQRLSRIKLKRGMDPSILFETLTSIQNQFLGPGKHLPAEEIIAIVLDVATEEYRPCLTVEQKLKGDKLTVEDLERAMIEEYRQFTRTQFRKDTSEGELLLFQFQGSCYNCGKSGHRANECPNESTSNKGSKEKGNSRGKFQGKCGTCGLNGHRSKDCWNKEENKDKRPANWKKRGQEKAAITVEKNEKAEEKSVEFGWVNDDLEELLTNSNLWIADTATVHSTANKSLSSDWIEGNDTVIVMGNGQKEDAVLKGSVKGEVLDSKGKSQGNIILSDVMYIPNGRYNLISVTKIMKQGWKLEGNGDGMSLSHGNKKLTFDKKIYTTKGLLYAVEIKPRQEMSANASEVSKVADEIPIFEAHR